MLPPRALRRGSKVGTQGNPAPKVFTWVPRPNPPGGAVQNPTLKVASFEANAGPAPRASIMDITTAATKILHTWPITTHRLSLATTVTLRNEAYQGVGRVASIHRTAEKGSSQVPAPLVYAASCMCIRSMLRAVTKRCLYKLIITNRRKPSDNNNSAGSCSRQVMAAKAYFPLR
jgi:hypothetical protein